MLEIMSKLEMFLATPQINALADFLSLYSPQMYGRGLISQGPINSLIWKLVSRV